jgi:Zn-dependent membrane protease YugP
MLPTLIWVLVAAVVYLIVQKFLLPRSMRFSALRELLISKVEVPTEAATLAQLLIDSAGLHDRVMLSTAEFDHYDSDLSLVLLANDSFRSIKLLPNYIAAHEVGHAIIDKSSRLLKLICDLSAYAQTPKVTKYIFVAFVVLAVFGSKLGMLLGLLALAVQLVAAVVILFVEMTATRYGTEMITDVFDIPSQLRESLNRCGDTALTIHASDVARPAALLLVFSQLTAVGGSLLMVAPVVALAMYFYLFLSCWRFQYRG